VNFPKDVTVIVTGMKIIACYNIITLVEIEPDLLINYDHRYKKIPEYRCKIEELKILLCNNLVNNEFVVRFPDNHRFKL